MGFAYFTTCSPFSAPSPLSFRSLSSPCLFSPCESFIAVLLRFEDHSRFLRRTIKVTDEYKCRGLKAVNSTSHVDISVRIREEANDLSFSSLTKRFLHFVSWCTVEIFLYFANRFIELEQSPCAAMYRKKESLLPEFTSWERSVVETNKVN